MEIFWIVYIVIVVFSVILHEVAHGYVAYKLGDPTAKLQGRLTLNPIPHIDPIGSIILPAILIITGSPFVFGWAKPVPYNPYNLTKGGKYAEGYVAVAGVATNLAIALLAGILGKVLLSAGLLGGLGALVLKIVVSLNLTLALFNLIPIPPLDGSKVLLHILPVSLRVKLEDFYRRMELNPFLGFGAVVLFLIVFGDALFRVVDTISNMLFPLF